ncbi:Transcription intermediary factor 1-alpha [Mactra antiquata]
MAYGGSFQAKMSEESFDFICTTCDRNNKIVEAVRYCIECSGYCCQACTDTHKLFPALMNHNLLDASHGSKVGQAGNQQSSLPEFPTERCSLHKGKVLELYCKEHDDAVCSTCISTSHKSCPETSILSVPDMIDSLFKLDDTKQIIRRLKEMVGSMTTISKSTDRKLQALKEAKDGAVEKVEIFEKALISIIRKAAKDSKTEIVAAYQELENEILQDKQNVDALHDDLNQSEGKLNKSEGNRAQRFVCTKQAEKKLKEADSIKVLQGKTNSSDIPISFTPNRSLMNYIEGLSGIGEVTRKKVDMYIIKGNKDINIVLSDDSTQCYAGGCCLTQDNTLIVTDTKNRILKRINLDTLTIVDYCKLNGYPEDVCSINDKEVAVTYYFPCTIEFVSIQHKMSPIRQIKVSHKCGGITFKDDKLYVTDFGSSVYVYSTTGSLLNTLTTDNAGTRLFNQSKYITFDKKGDKMFVSDGEKGLVCFDGAGNHLTTSSDSDLKTASEVCVDGNGNIFVAGFNSHNVVQYDEDGKKVGVIVTQQDGLKHPMSVCFHQQLNRLFVTMRNSDVIKMYELE